MDHRCAQRSPGRPDPDPNAAREICSRILNDMILDLARRYGVSAVVLALTEAVGCQSCVSEHTRGHSIRGLLERMGLDERGSDV